MKPSPAVQWLEAREGDTYTAYNTVTIQPMFQLKDDVPWWACGNRTDDCDCGDRMDHRHPMTDQEIRNHWTGLGPGYGWITLQPEDME